MTEAGLAPALLHHTLLRFIVDNGFGPSAEELARGLGVSEREVADGLRELQAEHGVVLHPGSTRVWVMPQ